MATPVRGLRRAAVTLLLLTCALLWSGPTAPPAAAASTYTIAWSTPAAFRAAVEALRPGDILRLQPGIYDIGGMVPALTPGTSTAPIRITAVDPDNPPVLKGSLVLRDADHWTLTRVLVQATEPQQPALTMAGGRGWAVTNSEFTGAATTGDYANVAISHSATGGPPRDWQFSSNCVHHAAARPAGDPALYMNIYVNIEGGGSNGRIARNILFNARGGDNIKIGAGGNASTVGASGIRIEYNTMYDALHQVMVFGNVRDIVLNRNLLIRSIDTSVKAGQYINQVPASSTGPRVTSTDNYGYLMDANFYARGIDRTAYVERGNILGADPKIVANCNGFRPSGAAAAYGRYA